MITHTYEVATRRIGHFAAVSTCNHVAALDVSRTYPLHAWDRVSHPCRGQPVGVSRPVGTPDTGPVNGPLSLPAGTDWNPHVSIELDTPLTMR